MMRIKKTIWIIFFLLLFAASSRAQTVKTISLTATTPSTFGIYDQFRLVPRATITNCDPGTFHVLTGTNQIMYCKASNTWVIKAPFEQSTDDILLTDTTNPAQKRFGVGTTLPTDLDLMLTLDRDGGIVARAPIGIIGTGRTLSTIGTGVRLIWYPRRGAFRAGGIDGGGPLGGTEWDDAFIGNYSSAFGLNNAAVGPGSMIATGANNRTTAAAAGSLVGGLTNTVSGSAALVMGANMTVSGNSSVAFGVGSTVGGNNTFAFGNGITANQNDSFIVANNTGTLNVGIGTTTPTKRLHVNAVLRLEPQASPPGSGSPPGCNSASDPGSLYVDSTPATTLCMCVSGFTWIIVAGTGNCT